MPLLIGIILIIAVAIWLIPTFPVNPIGALIVVIFGFFFASVSSRMVGLIGSSNNPVSGMAIATLIIATLILKATGTIGTTGMVGAIAIGGIICIVAAIAGDTSQDLKTGFIVGATPKKQQIGEMIGVVVSAAAIGFVLYLLNEAWGYGTEQIPAAQATMMKMLVEAYYERSASMGFNLYRSVYCSRYRNSESAGYAVCSRNVSAIQLKCRNYGRRYRTFYRRACQRYRKREKERSDRGVLFTSGLIAGEAYHGNRAGCHCRC